MIKTQSMDDVGRRLDFLMDLQDIWSGALALLTTKGWHSVAEQVRAQELEIALRLLGYYITANYSELGVARAINNLPDISKDNERE